MINLWFVFIGAEVVRNWYIIEKQKTTPNYLQSFILRGMASILHGIAVGVLNTQEYLILIGFQVGSFWILFDFALNLSRGKPPMHKGKKNWLDRIPWDLYWSAKTIMLALAVLCYFLIIGI